MPALNDLLNPISAESPAGKYLRYDPLYDKIKEARREDLDAAQGDWKIERKLADWPLTIKLTSDALATKTKDLQLAVWLTQALLRREGIASFRDGLEFVRNLLEKYWDSVYPEPEDGDLEPRAAPLTWLATESDREPGRPVTALKLVPLTRGGLNYVQFLQTREVGTEESVADSYEKQQARATKLEEGKTAPEVFDKDFDETPKAFYADLEKTFDGTLESLGQLSRFCDEKFADVSPSFSELQKVLEEIRQAVHVLLVRKREKEPDAEAPPGVEDPLPQPGAGPRAAALTRSTTASATALLTPLPASWEDAVARVVAAAKFMRQQDAASPTPYLMLRALRWGELRESRTSIDPAQLAAPPAEVRQSLRRAALDSNWAEVLETAETAMGMECGRGWLDLQRHVVRACQELGYERVRRAIITDLRNLLETYPQLPEMTMMDDMPTANAETLGWIKKQVLAPAGGAEGRSDVVSPAAGAGTAPPLRALDLAMQAARAGRPEVCTELLTREIAQVPNGRGRFQRRVQLAQFCQEAGNDAIALTMLQQAAAEIEEKKLEEWEPREMLVYALGLFYRCLAKSDGSSEERDRVYAWICRLDPLEAMKLER
jgi:type VI secretion system protein ImpA